MSKGVLDCVMIVERKWCDGDDGAVQNMGKTVCGFGVSLLLNTEWRLLIREGEKKKKNKVT